MHNFRYPTVYREMKSTFIKCHLKHFSPFFSVQRYRAAETGTSIWETRKKMREKRVPLELNFFKVLVSNQTSGVRLKVFREIDITQKNHLHREKSDEKNRKIKKKR